MTLLGSEHSVLIRSKFRSVLQLRLQQRRSREQLADQGTMPPLKNPAALHEQGKGPQRSKTGDCLKDKNRNRPEKSDLANMHVLQDADSEDDQMRLKRARLADDLNEKIALRPGPMELVEKNIIPVDSSVKEAALKVSHGALEKSEDSYVYEDDSSSDSMSPDHAHSDESQGSAGPHAEQKLSPAFITHKQSSKTSEKNRHKKPKDIKPKVKKLKYHQYIPPDQKVEKSPPPMDSAYARLLQQQQLFLQLQILSQQKHQQHSQHSQSSQHSQQHRQAQTFNYQPLLQPPVNKPSSEPPPSCSAGSSVSSSPVKGSYCSPPSGAPARPGPLPANLDDLKVSELRQQLRIRGLPVSGTKTTLIERLRPFRDSISADAPASGSLSYQSPSSSNTMCQGSYYPYCSSSTPPISPASSELSVSGSLADSFSDVTMSSPQLGLRASPGQLNLEEGGLMGGARGTGLEAEKDKMLVEKQKVIEELTWKLHQEQRQVEELRMQLHNKRKREHSPQDPGQSHAPSLSPSTPTHLQPPPNHMQQFLGGVVVKQEPLASSCPLASQQLKSGGPCSYVGVGTSSGNPSGISAFLSPQCSPQDSPGNKAPSSPQANSLPPSPSHSYLLSPSLGRDTHPGPQTHSAQQKTIQPMSICYPSEVRGLPPVYSSPADVGQNQRGPAKTKSHSLQHKMAVTHSPRHKGTAFCSSDSTASENKLPPRYEDAVKQQLSRSQQMDELLEVLIESGVSLGGTSSLPTVSKFHRHYEHMSSPQLLFEHTSNSGDCHFEALLSPMSRPGDACLVRTGGEEGHLEEVNIGFGGTQHDDKVVCNRDLMDTPLSPMANKVSPVPSDGQGLWMTFSESPWETMEWLELTPPSSAAGYTPMPLPGPSIFNSEFLDVTDINLTSAMDLQLEHW
ncbi:myocardin-like isoform X3 [Denticeps clupeoides]|uniref:myocardin-like isoform X3 n=1 Tax=Denticeps clupeoides TaxID=299321 RepID=UPI0010A39B04|nr:myocardin-like isoform X3 [Denticeps clupeoides]